jgi:hypothetical protein
MSRVEIIELKDFPDSLNLKSIGEGTRVSDVTASKIVVKPDEDTRVLIALSLPKTSSIKFENSRYIKHFGPFYVKGGVQEAIPVPWQLRRKRNPQIASIKIEVIAEDQSPPKQKRFKSHVVDLNEE